MTSNTTVAPCGAPAFLPTTYGSALVGMRPSERSATVAFEEPGPVERFADVLVVVPAVEHADLHELPVRAGAFGREPFLVPLRRGQRAQRVEAAAGDAPEVGERLRAAAVAVEHHPLLVELADVVADVRRVPDVRERRVLAEQHHLGADHVRDVVLHRPARAVGRQLPLRRR